MNYFATPVSSELPFNNYTKSVVNSINLDELKAFKDIPDYISDKSEDSIRLWGIKFDKQSRWNKIDKGDVLFFYRKGVIISWCIILDKFENKSLAEHIWGGYHNNYVRWFTWPFIIVLTKPCDCNVSFEKFNKMLGYVEGYSLRSFFKLNDKFKTTIEKDYKNVQDFIAKSS